MKAEFFASMVWISWQVGECEVSKSVCLIYIHPFVIRGQTGDQVACKFRLEIKFNLSCFCWCHFWHMVPITPVPASFRAVPVKIVRLTWKSLLSNKTFRSCSNRGNPIPRDLQNNLWNFFSCTQGMSLLTPLLWIDCFTCNLTCDKITNNVTANFVKSTYTLYSELSSTARWLAS